MQSFYGGKPGAPFVIVKSFTSKNEMFNAFKQGPAYTEVYFDEYVIVQPADKSDDSYGNVYRRGYNYQDEWGGAEYVGNIRGPAGPSREIVLTGDYNTLYNSNKPFVRHEVSKGSLVPGKDGNNFNDAIVWRYYNYTDPNDYKEKVMIGFRIPYPVFDFSLSQINAGNPPSIVKKANQHPFYHQYEIKLPRTIKGDSVIKISVIESSQIDAKKVDYSQAFPVPAEAAEKKRNNKNTLTPIITYTIRKQNNNGTYTDKEYYLCDFAPVKNIDVTDEGYLSFTLQGQNNPIQSSRPIVPQISNLLVDDSGKLSMDISNGGSSKKTRITTATPIKMVKNMAYNSNGDLQILWSTSTNGVQDSQIIKNPFKAFNVISDLKMGDDGHTLYKRYIGIDENAEKWYKNLNAGTLGTNVDRNKYIKMNGDYWEKVYDFSDMIANFERRAEKILQTPEMFFQSGDSVTENAYSENISMFFNGIDNNNIYTSPQPLYFNLQIPLTLPKFLSKSISKVEIAHEVGDNNFHYNFFNLQWKDATGNSLKLNINNNQRLVTQVLPFLKAQNVRKNNYSEDLAISSNYCTFNIKNNKVYFRRAWHIYPDTSEHKYRRYLYDYFMREVSSSKSTLSLNTTFTFK